MARVSWFVGGTLRRLKKPEKRPKGRGSTSIHLLYSDADASCLLGSGASFVDPEEERDQPPPPTPVTFPAYEIKQRERDYDGSKSKVLPDFQSLFAKVTKPSDISDQHVKALNVDICQPCSLEELLPHAPNGTSYLRPLTPAQATDAASSENTAPKADDAVSRKRKDFDGRLAELQVDNDTAFRTLSRKFKNDVRRPRLAYMRQFWEGLEPMSLYWDCSHDEYYELPAPETCSGKGVKRQRLHNAADSSNAAGDSTLAAMTSASTSTKSVTTSSLPTPKPSPTREAAAPKQSDCDRRPVTSPADIDRNSRSETASPEPRSRQRYKGRRTHTGREMPDQFRADAVRAFVEGTVWPFQCSATPPRVMPTVQFGNLILPVRQTAVVYRLPKDRTKARQGRLEGPILALQARAETDFEDPFGDPLESKSRFDLMRELAGLLQIAQERRREGKKEVKPGEGKWWTIKPRWGGGSGNGSENEVSSNSEIVQAAEEVVSGMKTLKDRLRLHARKRMLPVLLWKELRCPSGFWDPKVDYAAIGKEPVSLYDEAGGHVFMVSSLNHHISILKLTVYEAYTDYLISGAMPEQAPSDPSWRRPKLQRSKWFDLFDMQQRVEAFRGLWAVMVYLTRDTGEANRQGETADSEISSV